MGSAAPCHSESGCFSSVLSPLGPKGGPAVAAPSVSARLCCGRAPASSRPLGPALVASPSAPCLSSSGGAADFLFSEGEDAPGWLRPSRVALGALPWGLSGLGKGGARGWHLYLDGAESLLGGQRQPFIRDRGGSGTSPAGMRPCRLESLWEGRRYPGPKGVTSPGSSPEVLVSTCALSGPPSPLSPREEVSCHGICSHANCLAWSPAGLSPGGHWNGRWKGNP